MRKSVIANLGFVLQTAGILIILPIILAFYYQEEGALISLLLTSFAFLGTGFLMNALSERKELDFKSSCVLVTLTFFIVSLVGAIPYIYLRIFESENLFKNLLDSYFESISGYTTTGFSLLKSVENLPKSIVLYRSLTQWIGGIGIVYLILAFFYDENVLNNLLDAIGFRKTLSKIKNSMIEVLFIYSVYTVLFFLILFFLGLNDIVNALSITFSGLSTGGFSPISNLLSLNNKILWIISLIMITGSISFSIHHNLFFGKFRKILSEEFLLFLVIILFSFFFVFRFFGLDVFTSLFHIISASTATGFSFINISSLAQSLKIFLIALMFIGGSSFSTSGGIKVYRVLVILKSISYAIRKKLSNDEKFVIEGREMNDNEIILHLINVLVSLTLIFIVSFIFSLSGYDFVDSLFECTSAFSNVGMSAGLVSLELSEVLKILLIILMGIGRVEPICFLIAFYGFSKKEED